MQRAPPAAAAAPAGAAAAEAAATLAGLALDDASGSAPQQGASFADLPPELQRRIIDTAATAAAERTSLRASCKAACALLSASTHALCLPCCASELRCLAARCSQWHGLRHLSLLQAPKACAAELQDILVAVARHCPRLEQLSLEFESPAAAPPLLHACGAAAARVGRMQWPITRLCLIDNSYQRHVLSPLSQLNFVTSLKLALPLHTLAGGAWLPPRLRRLELGSGVGPMWLEAVPRRAGSLQELEFVSLLCPSDWGASSEYYGGCSRLESVVLQLTQLTSLAGVCIRLRSFEREERHLPPHLPPRLRRMLLYTADGDSLTPIAISSWPSFAAVAPGIEELAVTPPYLLFPGASTRMHPVLTALRSLHIVPECTPWPPDLSKHFPNLQQLIVGDLKSKPCWPHVASLAACSRLTRLCFVAPPGGYPEYPCYYSITPLSALTALRELELCDTLIRVVLDEDDSIWHSRHVTARRAFSEFQAAVRAPALTRLVLRHARDEHLPASGWPRGRGAAAAALQAASPAGAELQVVIDDDEAWVPCLLPRAAYCA